MNGKVIGFTEATNFITSETIATGPWSYFWVTNSMECALCGTETMVTFIIVPLVAGVGTLFFSKLDILLRGERARQPIFTDAQPRLENENYNFGTEKEVIVESAADGKEDKEEADGISDEHVEAEHTGITADGDGVVEEISA